MSYMRQDEIQDEIEDESEGEDAAELSPLHVAAKEIRRLMKLKHFTVRSLAEETTRLANTDSRIAAVSPATVGRLMRGQHKPEPATLDAVARALGIDPVRLMRLAGLPLPAPALERHPTAEYISQQIDELPPYYREIAIEAVAGVVDSFRRVARGEPANGINGEPILPPNKKNIAQPEEPGDVVTTIQLTHTQASQLLRLIELAMQLKESESMGKKEQGGLKDAITDALRELPDSWLDAVAAIVKGDKEGQGLKPVHTQPTQSPDRVG
jgi:transcriptional regulator with XRE-family HTH domain